MHHDGSDERLDPGGAQSAITPEPHHPPPGWLQKRNSKRAKARMRVIGVMFASLPGSRKDTFASLPPRQKDKQIQYM